MNARNGFPLIALAVVLTAGACEIALPETPPAPTISFDGALFPGQTDVILDETFAELAAADDAADTELLGTRVGGDIPGIRAAEYLVADAGGADPAVISSSPLAIYATSESDWPRIMVGVMDAAPAQTYSVAVWVQDDVRDPYQLRYWSAMIPGAVLPAMPAQENGTEMLDLDAEGFVLTPAEAIDQYVALLNDGSDSEFAESWVDDVYRDRMFKARAALAKAAKARNGTYTETIEPRIDEAFVLATAEEGALVFVPLDVTSKFTVPGAQLKLPAADKAVLGEKLTDRVVYHYDDYVVIHLRQADVGFAPEIVAASQHLVDITKKAS